MHRQLYKSKRHYKTRLLLTHIQDYLLQKKKIIEIWNVMELGKDNLLYIKATVGSFFLCRDQANIRNTSCRIQSVLKWVNDRNFLLQIYKIQSCVVFQKVFCFNWHASRCFSVELFAACCIIFNFSRARLYNISHIFLNWCWR